MKVQSSFIRLKFHETAKKSQGHKKNLAEGSNSTVTINKELDRPYYEYLANSDHINHTNQLFEQYLL